MDAKTVLCSKFVRQISSDEYFVLNTFHTISVLELGRSLAITISVKFPLVSKTELQKAKTIIEAQGILFIIYDLIIIKSKQPQFLDASNSLIVLGGIRPPCNQGTLQKIPKMLSSETILG